MTNDCEVSVDFDIDPIHSFRSKNIGLQRVGSQKTVVDVRRLEGQFVVCGCFAVSRQCVGLQKQARRKVSAVSLCGKTCGDVSGELAFAARLVVTSAELAFAARLVVTSDVLAFSSSLASASALV